MTMLYTVATANGQRASIALEECGIGYDARTLDLYAGEHRSKEMLELNPFGRVPVLVFDDGKTIYGSLAIGMHAARTSGVLLPPDEDMDTLMHWAGIIMTDLVPAFAGQFYLGTLAPEKFQWGLDHYAEIIDRFLRGIDDHLGTGDYFLRCGFTLADVLMYPTAATSVARMPGALESYRNIARWAERVGGRPAVLRGMEASA